MKQVTLVARVLAFLQGGDEAKITRFAGKQEKYLNNQITIRDNKILGLKDRITDAEEALNDAVVNIDVESIKSAEGAENYCPKYTQSIKDKLDAVNNLKQDIKDIEEQIKDLKELKEIIFPAEKTEEVA